MWRCVRCVLVWTATMEAIPAQTWEVTPFAGYLRLSSKPIGSLNSTAKDDDTTLHSVQPAFGVRATANTKGYYGLELGYMRSRAGIDSRFVLTDDETDTETTIIESGTVSVHQAFVNGLCYFMPRSERFRPFVTAGFQVQFWSVPRLPHWTVGNSRNIGINYGGGLKVRLFKSVLARMDARWIVAGAPYGLQYAEDTSGTSFRSPGRYSQFEASTGIGFTF